MTLPSTSSLAFVSRGTLVSLQLKYHRRVSVAFEYCKTVYQWAILSDNKFCFLMQIYLLLSDKTVITVAVGFDMDSWCDSGPRLRSVQYHLPGSYRTLKPLQ